MAVSSVPTLVVLVAGPHRVIQFDRQCMTGLDFTPFLVRASCDLSGWFQLVSELGGRHARAKTFAPELQAGIISGPPL